MPTYTTFTECIKSGRHLTDCDEDGYCNFCGYQDAAPSTPNPSDIFTTGIIVSQDGTWITAEDARFVWLPDAMNDEFADWSDEQRWQYAQVNGFYIEAGGPCTDLLSPEAQVPEDEDEDETNDGYEPDYPLA